MPDENLLTTLEQSLRQTRATRARLAARLTELELESEKIRTELMEMDTLCSQTEAAMFRILSSMLNAKQNRVAATLNANSVMHGASNAPTDADIEYALRQDAARNLNNSYDNANNASSHSSITRAANAPRPPAPNLHADIEPTSDRFFDRTIPQATSMLLREESGPLHVNEIYNRLREGGFNFNGQNPTISIAVSLNRNRRFRKVAPGTFDLVMRDVVQAS